MNRRDGATDVVVLLRGLQDAPPPSSAIVDPNVVGGMMGEGVGVLRGAGIDEGGKR